MTPEMTRTFQQIKEECGANSIERVEEMLDSNKKDRHPMQKQAKWILPGVSRQAWHDPYAYTEMRPIIDALESKYPEIKTEFDRVWNAMPSSFGSYEHYLVQRKDWKALYLYRKGALVRQAAALVPVTHGIVNNLAVRTGKLCPLLESHFSTLLPGATIPPHCDLWNFSINLHFAIDIPPDCAITVGGEERAWQEGKCLLFDYSFLHEAYNRSSRRRTCLLLDLWHPEVTLPERKALTVTITEIRKMMGQS
jgi:aspartyl/asparaginyl beta-hydroxylase (cupin superfamily)